MATDDPDIFDGTVRIDSITYPDTFRETQEAATIVVDGHMGKIIGTQPQDPDLCFQGTLPGFKVECDALIDGQNVGGGQKCMANRDLGATNAFSFEIDTNVEPGDHTLRFNFRYAESGDPIGSVEYTVTKESTISPPNAPEEYTIELSAPSTVKTGEAFDIDVRLCCNGDIGDSCPPAVYTLSIDGTPLMTETKNMRVGRCHTSTVSARDMKMDEPGEHVITASIGMKQATQTITVEKNDGGGTTPPPKDPFPWVAAGAIVAGYKVFVDKEDR